MGQSLSAPKVPTLTDSQIKEIWSPPSDASKQSSSVFFNSAISVHQLRELGHIAEEDESPSTHGQKLDAMQQRFKAWMSKSAQKSDGAIEFHRRIEQTKNTEYADPLPLEHTPPPPGFTVKPSPHKDPTRSWADYSLESNFTPTPTSNLQFNWEILPEAPKSPVKQPVLRSPAKQQTIAPVQEKKPEEEAKTFQLKAPPKKQKRAERVKFENEKVVLERITGRLKFYNLKKRFGFLTLDTDNSDVFLCEDDLVLSDVNLKQFKDDVSSGLKPRFELSVKVYHESDKEKKKAVNLTSLGHD